LLNAWRQQKLSTAIPAQFERLKDIPRRVAGFISAVVKKLPNRERGEIHQNIGAMPEKAYDTKNFVIAAQELNVTSHFAKNDKDRRSNLDRRTTRRTGYAVSLSRRWLVEKGFGWLKQTGPLRQVKLLGLKMVYWLCIFSFGAHNLIRLPKVMAQLPETLKQQYA
jgi:hypothetical protein